MDIDYKSEIQRGVIIIYETRLVIGKGANVSSEIKIFHLFTLGIKGTGRNNGFPIIGKNVVLSAVSKLFGNIVGEDNSIYWS